jgi:catechol-2,3-dioxygenase
MPKIQKVIETALYCDNLELMSSFYKEVLQLEIMVKDERLCAFNVNGQSVFLLFQREESRTPVSTAGGVIPPHHGLGPTHMAFAIEKNELSEWEIRLLQYNIKIVSQVQWPLGGTSIYFHDPENHLIELLTPGVWKIY